MVVSICPSLKIGHRHTPLQSPTVSCPLSSASAFTLCIVRIFYLKDHSKEASNEIALEAVYCLTNGYFVDCASVILHHMYRIPNLNRDPSLPYENLLTFIFTHFKVPLDLEECSTQPIPLISANSLKTFVSIKLSLVGGNTLMISPN